MLVISYHASPNGLRVLYTSSQTGRMIRLACCVICYCHVNSFMILEAIFIPIVSKAMKSFFGKYIVAYNPGGILVKSSGAHLSPSILFNWSLKALLLVHSSNKEAYQEMSSGDDVRPRWGRVIRRSRTPGACRRPGLFIWGSSGAFSPTIQYANQVFFPN